MKLKAPFAALVAASVAVSTVGSATAAQASTPRPQVEELPLTDISDTGINEPGAREPSEQTAQVTNRSTTNVPGVFLAHTMALGANSADSSQSQLGGATSTPDTPAPTTPAPSTPAPTTPAPVKPAPTTPAPTDAPTITGSAKDKTEDGITIASISKAVKVPANNPSVVGVSYSGDTNARFEVRTKTADGWGAWTALDSELTGEGTPGTEPFVVAGASNVQLRVLGDKPATDAKLVLVDPKRASGDSAAVANNAPVPQAPAAATSGDAAAAVNQYGLPSRQDQTCDDSGCTGVVTAHNVSVPAVGMDVVNTAVTKVAKPPIASRKAWGADESLRRSSPSYAPKVKAAVIHHTAGSNNYSAADVPSIIRGIYTFHVKGRGWNDVGYNVLVDKFGRLWQGRAGDIDRAVIGAHVSGYNSGTFGISVMGSYDSKAPSAEAINAVEQAIAWKLGDVGAKDTATVNGRRINAISAHRDLGSTTCPGDAFYARMGEIRNAVADLQSGKEQPAQAPEATPLTPIQSAYAGKEDVLGKPRGNEFAFGDGRVQHYEHGYITWSEKTGAVVLRGAIANAWVKNRDKIGLPLQDEKPLKRGAFQSFEKGAMHWSPATGAHATYGPIWTYWKDKGFERGHMGYPTTDPVQSGSQTEQEFEGARVVFAEGFGTMEYAPGPAIRGGAVDTNDAAIPGEKPAATPTEEPTKAAAPKKEAAAPKKEASKPKEKKEPSSDQLREDIVNKARTYIGTPYVWGGNTPQGWDCSGYVRYVYSKFGIDLPRTSSAQAQAGRVISESEAKPGDLVWIPGHIGIVSDKDGMMLDAGSPRTNTSERSYDWMRGQGMKFIRVIED